MINVNKEGNNLEVQIHDWTFILSKSDAKKLALLLQVKLNDIEEQDKPKLLNDTEDPIK